MGYCRIRKEYCPCALNDSKASTGAHRWTHMISTKSRITTFHQLHQSGCFVIPNPWDAGSARALVALGFKALATTSAGHAWAAGRPDHGVQLEPLLAHLRDICGSVDVPVTADFENGLAD